MTVGQLLKTLKDVPKSYKIILSSDAEGNEWNDVDEVLVSRASDKDTDIEGKPFKGVVFWPR